MSKNNKAHKKENDYIKDLTEFQNNMYNPGHYVGTGKVPPTVSAPGNAMPMAVMCIFAAIFWAVFGLFLFFSDARIAFFSLIKSDIANKIIALIIMLAISLFFVFLGLGYLRKFKRYYKQKTFKK